MTRAAALHGRAGALPASAFIDLTGRDRVKRIALVAVACVAALAYANALANGFVLDDGGVIARNPLVTSPGGAWRTFVLPYWPAPLGGGQYRPLGILSFALDWLVSGGDARWFHAINVLWHIAATAAVWMLAAELLAPASAAIAATLFAVHPVHVEAVANVVGRLEPMAAAFVLVGLIAHRRASWSAPVWLALGLLSKESAIVLVALVAANDWLLERDWRAAFRARRWLYGAYGGVALVYAAVLVAVFWSTPLSVPARAFAGVDTLERLALVARTIPHYARLLIAPLDLSASYAPNVISPAPGITLGSVVGVLILLVTIGALVYAIRRRRAPLEAFVMLWILIALAPVSNVLFPSGVVLAERTMYLPSVGICLAAGALAERFFASRMRVVTTMAATLVIVFAARTWTRTPVWTDDRTYLLTLIADHPESYEAHLAAGRALKGANALAEADRELTMARQLFPRDSVVYREAADLADRQQRPALAAALRDSARVASSLPLGTGLRR